MKLAQYNYIYFLGIGGIGMSALARWFARQGLDVSGYDRTRTALTSRLEQEGMQVHYDDVVDSIPVAVRDNPESSLVVYTPALPPDHRVHAFLRERGYTILKRAEVLGLISRDHVTVAVAGTHGKTTTSSMVAHLLKTADIPMVAFLGGVTTNYGSNLVMNGDVSRRTIVVAEADEFDRSFLKLYPNTAIVTSADPDHLDIFGDHEQMLTSFRAFVNQIREGGHLIIHESIAEKLADGVNHVTKHTYSMSRGQFFAGNITAKSGFFEFDLEGFDRVEHVRLGVPGFHNIENAVAAAVAAWQCGVDLPTIRKGLESFSGVKRRFEFVVRRPNIVYVDDYAHHPTEIEAFLKSMKSLFPGKKLTVVFQPHLYTRTRDFADGFSKSLSIADEVFVMDIYPARELAIPGIDADLLLSNISSPAKHRCGKNDLLDKLEAVDIEVLATLGAGDIDTFVQPIRDMLEKKYAA